MIMYVHAKFSPPTSVSDKRFAYEYCSIYTNKRRYSIQELESECFDFATKQDIGPCFCISECTKASPAVFIFSVDNYKMTQLYATRHFLKRALVIDGSDYQVNIN